MSTLTASVVIVLICSFLAVISLWYARRQRMPLAKSLSLLSPPQRKLTAEERFAVERYLASLGQFKTTPEEGRVDKQVLTLTPNSDNVYAVTQAITRYGLSTQDQRKWRYFLDATEVHLPPRWEQYITDENVVELINTHPIPLVISLNGHVLADYNLQQPAFISTLRPQTHNASIRKEESENVELVQVRKETPEEFALSRSAGIRESLVICAALLLYFLAIISPANMLPWLCILATAMTGVSLWFLYRFPGPNGLRDVHCLRGAPKRWGLFGESNQEQSNITLGIIDLHYPPHWQPYVANDLGKVTDVEIYLNRQVVRQGRFLSLQDEVQHFPVQRWRKNVVLAIGSLLVLALLISWIPLSMPLKLSFAWVKGTDTVEATSVQQLSKSTLHVGDYLKVSGQGMCSVPDNLQNNRSSVYMPFDCSAIYWNSANPLPLPQSDIIDKASALLTTTTQQLHPETNSDPKINPQLASAIQKSGMILLDDFSDLVLKTQDLCSQQQDCIRLKNALVNLGNAKDWQSLVKRADSGQLNGMNVLLRPVSAEALENLVNTATSTFFYRETRRAAENLNSPPPGGFLIVSDQGRQWVNQPQSGVSLFDMDAPAQWQELQRIAGLLLHTSFSASGVITSITTDANGTQHIALHHDADSVTQWRYPATTLLLLVLIVMVICNSVLALRRIHLNRVRMANIHQYYEKCFNQSMTAMQSVRPIF
ncbi:IgaA/UmoB family intracellular growth attenuator [Pantoea sp. A4]|uniref:IgaA/UmoB family intracellular growth attenuator n=1 Tax=Pantoea sp. A4 TaxID=1225184 RepID=UPI0004745FB8|nr:IgaA/UmoB family intracellular growth attenuator [Pantoea sp. A4]